MHFISHPSVGDVFFFFPSLFTGCGSHVAQPGQNGAEGTKDQHWDGKVKAFAFSRVKMHSYAR